jgi:hypothetical protein
MADLSAPILTAYGARPHKKWGFFQTFVYVRVNRPPVVLLQSTPPMAISGDELLMLWRKLGGLSPSCFRNDGTTAVVDASAGQ